MVSGRLGESRPSRRGEAVGERLLEGEAVLELELDPPPNGGCGDAILGSLMSDGGMDGG